MEQCKYNINQLVSLIGSVNRQELQMKLFWDNIKLTQEHVPI